MSPQLSVRCLLAVLIALLTASLLGLLAIGPIALSMPAMPRSGFGWTEVIPGVGLVVACMGLGCAARLPGIEWRHPWRCYFALAAVAALLCLFDTMSSGPQLWQLGRMAIGSAGAVAALIFLAERLGPAWVSRRALALALMAGPIAAAVGWLAESVHGQPDERWLIWLEWAPLMFLPLGIWDLSSRLEALSATR
jgi:hypothetical protein